MAHEKLRPTPRTSRQTCPIVFATHWRGLDTEVLILFLFSCCGINIHDLLVASWFGGLPFQVKIFLTKEMADWTG